MIYLLKISGEGAGLRGPGRQVRGLLTVNKRAILVTAGNAFGRNFSHLTFSPKITAAKIFLFSFAFFLLLCTADGHLEGVGEATMGLKVSFSAPPPVGSV